MELNRKLASILLYKLGGNVDHNLDTVLQELIDNSRDAHGNIINIYLEEYDGISYLIIEDNGIGIKNIENIFMGDEAKKDKKGCKNQGFLDTLAFLSQFNGEVDIFTKYEDSYSRINVDFSEMRKEFDRQNKDLDFESIDYGICQKKLEQGYTKFNKKHTLEYLESKPKIFEKIKNGGTYIKIQLHNDFDIQNMKNININQFQYLYKENFQLNFMGKVIQINDKIDICHEDKFKAAECLFFRNKHTNGTELYKITTNFGVSKFYKKTTNGSFNKIKKEEHSSYVKSCKNTEKIATFKFSLISANIANLQKEIFQTTSIDVFRNLYISYKGKVLGPFKYPSKNKGIVPRNLYDIRTILEIQDENLIKDIIMTNKSKTNLDNINHSIIKFIEEIKEFFKIGNQKLFSEIPPEKRPGIPNMVKYLKDEIQEKQRIEDEKKRNELLEKIRIENERKKKKLLEKQRIEEEKKKKELLEKQRIEEEKKKKELLEKQRIEEEKRKQELLERQKQELLEKKRLEEERIRKEEEDKKANYQKWKGAIYFGVLNCSREKGISAENNRFTLHYGFTNDDPNHRDSGSGLGTGWRRIFYCPINNDGSALSAGKRVCEWKIHEILKDNEKELNITWTTKEYFTCPRENVNKITKIIRKIVDMYEEDW